MGGCAGFFLPGEETGERMKGRLCVGCCAPSCTPPKIPVAPPPLESCVPAHHHLPEEAPTTAPTPLLFVAQVIVNNLPIGRDVDEAKRLLQVSLSSYVRGIGRVSVWV